MTDEATPKRGRPNASEIERRHQIERSTVVEMVKNRLADLLAREAAVGASTPTRLFSACSGNKTERIGDEEARGRLFRLLEHSEYDVAALENILSQVATALHQSAPNIVEQSTPNEILSYFGSEEPIVFKESDVAELTAALVRVERRSRNRSSELRRLISGRFGAPPERGRNPNRRSRELAAELIGFTQGLSRLPTVGQRSSEGEKSTQIVLSDAWHAVEKPADPVALAVYTTIPRTPHALERLSRECIKDEYLEGRRILGHRQGRRVAKVLISKLGN